MIKYIGAILLAILMTGICHADRAYMDEVNPIDDLSPAYLVKVIPGPKRFFYWQFGKGCPSLIHSCRRPNEGYVVPGDVLIASGQIGLFTRVTFVSRNGLNSSEGLIESAGLKRLGPHASQTSDWLGRWQAYKYTDMTIKRSRTTGRLIANGNAEWGSHDNPHFGDFSAVIEPHTDTVGFTMADDGEPNALTAKDASGDTVTSKLYTKNADACSLKLRLLRPYIIAYSNDRCGGLNVGFSGVYRKH